MDPAIIAGMIGAGSGTVIAGLGFFAVRLIEHGAMRANHDALSQRVTELTNAMSTRMAAFEREMGEVRKMANDISFIRGYLAGEESDRPRRRKPRPLTA